MSKRDLDRMSVADIEALIVSRDFDRLSPLMRREAFRVLALKREVV